MVEFFVESGPDRGESFLLDANRATFGRAPDNTFRLAQDETVAEYHAVVLRRGSEWYIAPARRSQPEALLLNGRLVRRPTRLRYGDRIRMGQNTLEYAYSTDRLEQMLPPWHIVPAGHLSNFLWALFICLISIASAVALFRRNLPTTVATDGHPLSTSPLPSLAMDHFTATPPAAGPTEPADTPTPVPTFTPTIPPPQLTDTPPPAAEVAPAETPSPSPSVLPPTPTEPTLPTGTVEPPPTPTPNVSIAVFDGQVMGSPTASAVILVNGCRIPGDWQPYTVQWGDTLWQIAERFETTAQTLIEGNCLEDEMIYADDTLYVPPVP